MEDDAKPRGGVLRRAGLALGGLLVGTLVDEGLLNDQIGNTLLGLLALFA